MNGAEADFFAQCARFLQEHWPDLEFDEAEDFMRDYVSHIGFGSSGYDWSRAGAKDLADAYASEFGETG